MATRFAGADFQCNHLKPACRAAERSILRVRYGIGDRFFCGLLAVFFNLSTPLKIVCQAAGSADAASYAGHAFDEVRVKNILFLLKQSLLTFFDPIT